MRLENVFEELSFGESHKYSELMKTALITMEANTQGTRYRNTWLES